MIDEHGQENKDEEGRMDRDNFKMPRTGFDFPDLDTAWKVNRKLWVTSLFFRIQFIYFS